MVMDSKKLCHGNIDEKSFGDNNLQEERLSIVNNQNTQNNVYSMTRQRFERLFQSLEQKRLDRSFTVRLPCFKDIGKYIDCNYFYETAAHFSLEERKRCFYDSLKIGDKFIAKVLHIYNRNADVHLVWSDKRDIYGLKLKANLKLDSYHHHHHHHHRASTNSNRNNNYKKKNDDEYDDHNIEISELINVELINYDRRSMQINVIRCESSNVTKQFHDDDLDEIDETSIQYGKYRTIGPDQQSFNDYMMDHNDLRNPSLIKLYPFTSIKNSDHIIKCIEYRNEIKIKQQQQQKIIDITDKAEISQNVSDISLSKSSLKKQSHSLPSSSSSSSKSNESESKSSSSYEYQKRKRKKIKKRKNKKHHKKKKLRNNCSSPSSSSSDSSEKFEKLKKKKSKHHHHHHHHRDRSKKIDNKILQLLKFT